MNRGVPRIVVSGKNEALDYALQVIVDFNRGIDRIGLIAYGENICKLADIVVELKRRLGDSVVIESWDIDSKKSPRGRRTYLYVELRYKPL